MGNARNVDTEKRNGDRDKEPPTHGAKNPAVDSIIMNFLASPGHELTPQEENEILAFPTEDLYALIEQLSDPEIIKKVVQIKFLAEAKLQNDDPKNPFIVWEPMNRKPENWLALALAKIVKAELNIQPGDVILMIPSSGSWLAGEFEEQFPENLLPELKKDGDLNDDDKIFKSFEVRSHSNGREPKTMHLCTNPELLAGKRIVIIDDVMARGDAVGGLIDFLESLGLEVLGYDAAVVMDKTMQNGSTNLTTTENEDEKPVLDSYQAIISVGLVEIFDETDENGAKKYKFTLE